MLAEVCFGLASIFPLAYTYVCTLLQRHEDGNWRLLLSTERNYAMVELELLGVKWAVQKLRKYLLVLTHFSLAVDHQPLISILL